MHAFLSYVREDSQVVDEVADFLRSHGVSVWLDRDDIEPGRFWKDSISQAIKSGAFFIAFFSLASEKRLQTYMNEELSLAQEQLRLRSHDSGWFIPVLIDDVLPPAWSFRPNQTFRDIQAVRWFDRKERAKTALLRALGINDLNHAEENQLLSLLASKFPDQRDYSLQKLSTRSNLSSRAIDNLISMVFHEDSQLRQREAGLHILKSKIGDKNIIDASRIFIEHNDEEIRLMGYQSLFQFGGEFINFAYIALGDSCSRVRAEALNVIGEKIIDEYQALETILRHLKDESKFVRDIAIDILFKDRNKSIWQLLSKKDVEFMVSSIIEHDDKLEIFHRYLCKYPNKEVDINYISRSMRDSHLRRVDREADKAWQVRIPDWSFEGKIISRYFKIRNRRGLCARPSAMLVQTCSKFNAEFLFQSFKNPELTAGLDIFDIIMLAVAYQETLRVDVFGPEAKLAIEAIENLIVERQFGMD